MTPVIRPLVPPVSPCTAGALPSWSGLWRDLVERRARPESDGSDFWAGRAHEFQNHLRRLAGHPDPLRSAVLAVVTPASSIVDIGAGTGAWTLPLARQARTVTAVDDSPTMIALLEQNVTAAGATNVRVVRGTWPDVDVRAHDYCLAAHSVYGVADLPGFIRAMTVIARRQCFLVLRVALPGSILAEAARHIWHLPVDGPNLGVAFNVLLEMGLAPNVLMDATPRESRSSADLPEALARVKRHFGLTGPTEHDASLRELLHDRLVPDDGRLRWPDETRSALVSWEAE